MPTRGTPPKKRTFHIVALSAILLMAAIALSFGINNWLAERRAKRMPNPVPSTEENLKAGAQIYSDHCVQCHGVKGDGKGQKAAQLSVEPGNLTDSKTMHQSTDGELFWRITVGRNPMPAYEDKLTPTQRWQAVDYIRRFAKPSDAAAVEQPAASGHP